MPTPSLPDAIGAHLAALAARGYAAATCRNRRTALRLLADWCAAHDAPPLEPATLGAFAAALARRRRLDGAPLAAGTCLQYLQALRTFLRWTHRALGGPDPQALDLGRPRRPRPLPRVVLDAAEAEQVLAQPALGTRLGLRDRAILETFYGTGVRRLELIRLRLGDVDWPRAVLAIREGKGRRDRLLPLGRRVAHWLGRYVAEARPRLVRAADAGSLFLTARGHAFRPSRLSERVRAYVAAARLGKQGSCHLFRHTMATLLLEGGADVRYVQELLGHAQLSTTAVYTHVTLGRLATVYAQAHPGERAFQEAARGETGQLELWP